MWVYNISVGTCTNRQVNNSVTLILFHFIFSSIKKLVKHIAKHFISLTVCSLFAFQRYDGTNIREPSIYFHVNCQMKKNNIILRPGTCFVSYCMFNSSGKFLIIEFKEKIETNRKTKNLNQILKLIIFWLSKY